MIISILDYSTSEVCIIENAPDMETNEEAEDWLVKHGFRLNDIYFMFYTGSVLKCKVVEGKDDFEYEKLI